MSQSSEKNQELPGEVSVPPTGVNPRLIPRIKRTTDKPTLLPFNVPFRNRWLVKGLIGQGGYGEIYYVHDTKTKEDVALKVEPKVRRNKTAKRMMLEQRVLVTLRGKPHAPFMLGSGRERRINFISMQLMSVNVGDLKKQSPVSRLSRSTVGRVMVQAIAALRDIHQSGYVHRDVKPANMCFGISPCSKYRLILLDFGLVRRYLNDDGTLRPPRQFCGFRGTMRYVSLRVHAKQEQAPVDDLCSLLYSGLELLLTELPWRNKSSQRDIRKGKEELFAVDFANVSDIAGEVFCDFGRSVSVLQSDDEPDYTALQKILMDMYHPRKLSDPYDWDVDYRDVEYERKGVKICRTQSESSGLRCRIANVFKSAGKISDQEREREDIRQPAGI